MDNFDIDSFYNKETGEAIYTITDGVFNFVGRAKCHENDKDFDGQYTLWQKRVVYQMKDGYMIPTTSLVLSQVQCSPQEHVCASFFAKFSMSPILKSS